MEDNNIDQHPVVSIYKGSSCPVVPSTSSSDAAGGVVRPFQAGVIRNASSSGQFNRRCLGLGLGGILEGSQSVRIMAPTLASPINQCKRTSSSFLGSVSLEGVSAGPCDSGFLRQCVSSGNYEEKRIREVSPALANPGEDRSLMRGGINFSRGTSRGGISECSSRRSISVLTSAVGMESTPRGVPEDLCKMGSPSGGPMRNPRERENRSVCFASSDSVITGLSNCAMGEVVPAICVSPKQTSLQASAQVPSAKTSSASDPSVSMVAKEAVVSSSDGSSTPIDATQSSPLSAHSGGSREDCMPFQSQDPGPSRRDIIRQELEEHQWDISSISVLENSLRPQSSAVYERFWSEFTKFALARVSSLSEVSLAVVTAFLHHLAFKRNLKVSTIKSYVSAIKFPLQLILKKDITDCPAYAKFMRGLVALFPVERPRPVAWNLDVVLAYLKGLEPLQEMQPEIIFSKCLFLVAVATGRRVSELASLGWDDPFLRLSTSSASMIYTPNFLGKNETPISLHAPIMIQAVSSSASDAEERFVCPVRALYHWREYVKKNPRRDPLQLFQLPSGTKASTREISKHLVQVIKKSHESLKESDARRLNIRAHDVRAVAASRVWSQRLAWSDLAGTFSWKNKSVFVSVYSRGMTALRDLRSD